MNPFLVSLGLVVTLAAMMTVWIILPTFNLHIVNSSTSLLRDQAQQILDRDRTSPNRALADLRAIDLNNIEINTVEMKEENDFLNYTIQFNFKNLFTNKFATKESHENKQGSLEFLMDKA